jgi:ubiquinone biosynthesis monooxygenase Coq7
MPSTQLSLIDTLIVNADRALRTLAAGSDMTSERASPARSLNEADLSEAGRKKSAALMRLRPSALSGTGANGQIT